jgi:hypothetical protein
MKILDLRLANKCALHQLVWVSHKVVAPKFKRHYRLLLFPEMLETMTLVSGINVK